MTVPPPPAGLQRIKHIVMLMLENRSFDNLLGWLYDTAPPARGQPFEGLNRGLWNPLDNIDLDGVPFIEKVYVRKNGEPADNDQHPPHDIRPGEALIAEVYQAVARSPQWNETVLLITDDEHGGCYDHFPPPNHATPPDPDAPPGQDGFLFNRFGVRVPTVVVSPWIEAGTVCRAPGRVPFDHTSIIATVRNCLGLKELLRAAVPPKR